MVDGPEGLAAVLEAGVAAAIAGATGRSLVVAGETVVGRMVLLFAVDWEVAVTGVDEDAVCT